MTSEGLPACPGPERWTGYSVSAQHGHVVLTAWPQGHAITDRRAELILTPAAARHLAGLIANTAAHATCSGTEVPQRC